jgi:hypothetical protein
LQSDSEKESGGNDLGSGVNLDLVHVCHCTAIHGGVATSLQGSALARQGVFDVLSRRGRRAPDFHQEQPPPRPTGRHFPKEGGRAPGALPLSPKAATPPAPWPSPTEPNSAQGPDGFR